TIVFVSAIVTLVVGGAILMGNARFQINLLTGQGARFTDLFSQIHRLWAGFSMIFLQGLFVYLWSLLLVIPGIIASYRYALMPYLWAGFPELSARDAMRESKRLMRGNKWRLFCLQLSFLGCFSWAVLPWASVCCGSTPISLRRRQPFIWRLPAAGLRLA